MRTLVVTWVAVLVTVNLVSAQDSRTVSEPSFPVACTTLAAQLSINNGEPSSETAFDTARIQAALKACPAGKAVELVASGNNNAFLIAPITLPSGVTLLVDAGVTVFASRNPADYQKGTPSKTQEACGTVGTISNGCSAVIESNGTAGSGIMGYGIIDGRGADYLIVNGVTQPYSWYTNTLQAYATNPLGIQNNPDMVLAHEANDFTLYKITLRNGPHFNLHWYGEDGSSVTSGLTVWGIKILQPYTIANTDGIDPTDNSTNVTITDSYISNGDDQVAVSAKGVGNPITNVSITNIHTFSGRGISIGSYTEGGVANVLVDTISQAGNAADPNGNGFRIKSVADRGGLVQNVTFQNICQRDETYAIRLYPFYETPANTNLIPTFSNIAVRNVTILANPSGGAGSFTLEGYDGNHITTLTLDNLNVLGTPDVTKYKPENIAINLGPGPVNPVSLQKLTGTGVTYTGSVTNPAEAPYPCSAANFPTLVGELFLSTANSTNLRTLSTFAPAAFNLNAVIQATALEYPAPTSPITFFEGGNPVGSAAIGGNGTLATLTLSGILPGIHTYTAQYPADSNHPQLNFGSVTVTVNPALTVVNGASFRGGPLTPGELISIFGTGLGPASGVGLQKTPDGKSLTTALGGTQVLFDGTAAPLTYVSATQVNAIVPFELTGAASTQMVVEAQSVSSSPVSESLAISSPAIFAASGGSGQGAVLNQDNSPNSASNPASAGSVLQIFATGFGQTAPAGVDGQIAGATPSLPLQAVTATLGGIAAPVQYAGSSNGLVAGVTQVNVQIPTGVSTGSAVPLVISVAGNPSPSGVTVAVH